MDMNHLRYLQEIANKDVEDIKRKESTYQGSWKKRGGIGAFMMLARKWDRLENMSRNCGYDIFSAIMMASAQLNEPISGQDGTALAEVRDLRCYLLLVEAEIFAREDAVKNSIHPGTPEDG